MNPDLPALPRARRFCARLVENRILNPSTHHLRFQSLQPFQYISGQFVAVHRIVHEKPDKRAYSMAAESESGEFAICLNRVPEGPFSNYLCDLTPGNEIECDGPYGVFVPRISERETVFVATGTGIGPIRSILRDLLRRGQRAPLHVVFGSRHEDGILYREEMEGLAARCPGFSYLPTLTRPPQGWKGAQGRVQAHLAPFLARPELRVYICGLRAMVEDVRERFKHAGFERREVIHERFD